MKEKLREIRDRSTKPQRVVRDRGEDEAPVKTQEKRGELDKKKHDEILGLLKESEAARITKNASTKIENESYDRADALLKEAEVEHIGGRVKIDGVLYDLAADYQDTFTKRIDLAKLKASVKKSVWEACLVVQVGLVEKNAGKNVVNECTVSSPGGKKLKVSLTEVGGK